MSDFYPDGFEELERFAAWSLPTERERAHKRVDADYAELEELYHAVHDRLPEIVKHLDQFPLTELPEDAARLMLLMLSLAEVAPAVEFYQQPQVYDGVGLDRFTIFQ